MTTVLQWNCWSFRRRKADFIDRFQLIQGRKTPAIIALQKVNGPLVRIPSYEGYAPRDDATQPVKAALFIHRGFTHVELDTQPWCKAFTEVAGCRVEISPHRTILVFSVYICAEGARKKSQLSHIDLSFVQHFQKLYPKDVTVMCGDFNAQHVAWGYEKTSARGKHIMADATAYGLTLLNAPLTHTRLGQTQKQADTTPDLSWVSHSKLARWETYEDTLGSDHLPILIHLRTGGQRLQRTSAGSYAKTAYITHWDKYRCILMEEPSAARIKNLTDQLCIAKEQSTKKLRVPPDHPEPDRHLVTLWNRRLRIFGRYKKSGRAPHLKQHLLEVQKKIESHTNALATERWMDVCETINGHTHASKVWAFLRSLHGQRETNNSAARVALLGGVSVNELAEEAAAAFFPQTSHPSATTYNRDDTSANEEAYNVPFTMTK